MSQMLFVIVKKWLTIKKHQFMSFVTEGGGFFLTDYREKERRKKFGREGEKRKG